MTLNKTVNRRRELPIGLILVLICTLVFMVRFMKVALSRNILGNHAYVQMINEGIPILKGSYYDKDAYEESPVTVGSLVMEALYINKINPQTILSSQIAGFSNFASNNELVLKEEDSIDSFTLNDSSVDKKVQNEEKKTETEKMANEGVRNPNIRKTLDQSKPEILIYHTHTAEGYGAEASTNDQNKNVVGVAALVEKELEEYYGVSVIHDKTMYAADYNSAYKKSREGLKKYLDKYDDFKVIIDLHRDGGPKREKVMGNINGENVAKLYFPTGKNNAHYADNKALIDRLDADIKKYFPEIHKGVLVRERAASNAYNQDLSKNALLMEVGSENSMPEDAMNAAKYIARIIAEEVYRQDNK